MRYKTFLHTFYFFEKEVTSSFIYHHTLVFVQRMDWHLVDALYGCLAWTDLVYFSWKLNLPLCMNPSTCAIMVPSDGHWNFRVFWNINSSAMSDYSTILNKLATFHLLMPSLCVKVTTLWPCNLKLHVYHVHYNKKEIENCFLVFDEAGCQITTFKNS